MNKELTKDQKFESLKEKYPKGTYPSLEEYNKMDSVEKTFFDLPDILNNNIGEEWKELDHQKLPVNEEIKLSDKLIHSLKLQKEDDPRFYLLKTLSKRQIRLFDDEEGVKRLLVSTGYRKNSHMLYLRRNCWARCLEQCASDTIHYSVSKYK